MITGRINQIASSVKYGDVLRRGRPGFFFPLPTDRIPCAFRPGERGESCGGGPVTIRRAPRESDLLGVRKATLFSKARNRAGFFQIVRGSTLRAGLSVVFSILVSERKQDSGAENCFPHDNQVAYSSGWRQGRRKKASPPDCDGVRRNLTTSLGLPVRFSDFPETRPRPLESVRERPGYRRLRAPTVPFRHGSSGRLW